MFSRSRHRYGDDHGRGLFPGVRGTGLGGLLLADIAAAAAAVGDLDWAERIARAIPDEYAKAEALARIAAAAAADPDRAERLIADAERIAQAGPDEYAKAEVLARIAAAATAVDLDWAERISRAIPDEYAKAEALARIAAAATAVPDLSRAERIAQAIPDQRAKAWALADIAGAAAAGWPVTANGPLPLITSRLADAPELAGLPWEFLYDPRHNRFLALSRRTPLVRYLDLPDPPRPLDVEGPLRVLVMISSRAGSLALDVEQEWRLLTDALAEQQSAGRVIIERLDANMGMLRRRLRRGTFHVFHFIGHGFFRPDWDDGVLVMVDRHGRPHEVIGEELGGLLNEYDQTRLAVLNACEGARGGASDPFAGTAQSLIQQGPPAVVAMQFEITYDAAVIFAQELYAAVPDGLPLEAALAGRGARCG